MTKKSWTEGAQIAPAQVGDTKNLTAFGDRVYFSAQPSPEDLKAFSALGVKNVINLRTAAEMQFDERAAASAAGMNYVHAPMTKDAPPAEGDVAKAFDTLEKAGDEPVLLHCASSNRVGYMWATFRATRQGVPVEQAITEGKAAGMKSPELEQMAREYIQKNAAPK